MSQPPSACTAADTYYAHVHVCAHAGHVRWPVGVAECPRYARDPGSRIPRTTAKWAWPRRPKVAGGEEIDDVHAHATNTVEASKGLQLQVLLF
jgi:hypothetical protein